MTRAPGTPTVSFATVAEVADALRRRGGRLTAPRRRVLEALFAAEGPIAAERVAMLGGLELTSVYRTLESLEEMGVVRHTHLGHGPGLYALTGGTEREYLVCERCGRVTTVDAARLDGIRDQIERSFGFRARFGHFPIVGLCGPCTTRPDSRAQQGDAMPHDEHAHEHDHPHTHEHQHGDHAHAHPHTHHDHEHTEHEHQHTHGDYVHAHPHVHEEGLEDDHAHEH